MYIRDRGTVSSKDGITVKFRVWSFGLRVLPSRAEGFEIAVLGIVFRI